MRWVGIVLAGSVIATVACGGGKGGNDPDDPKRDASTSGDALVDDAAGSDAATSDAPIDAPPITMTTIGTGGGTVTTPDGVAIVIPAGALATDTTITVTVTVMTNDAVSHVYELGPANLTFAEPIEITLPFDPSLLGTTSSTDLALAFRNQAGDSWRSSGYAVVDDETKTVTGYASHFSQWAIVPSPPGTGCNLDYNCFSSCCGVAAPDLCCSLGRGTCHCRSTRSFKSHVTCYANCVQTPSTTNFANSKCMKSCCTQHGGSAARVGVCYTNSRASAQAILDCGRGCGAMGEDEHSLCGTGPITFDACTWNASMNPGIGPMCPGAGGGLNSQHLRTDLATVFAQSWGTGAEVQITGGAITPNGVSATLTCEGGAQTGSFSATRNGSGYTGTWTFGADTGNISINPAW